MVRNKKAQSLSLDVLIVVAILLFGIIFLIMNQTNNVNQSSDSKKFKKLEENAQKNSQIVLKELKSNYVINEENNVEVDNLLQVDVQKIKNDLDITGEFAIVFEKDGKLVKIDPTNNITCIGSDKIVVNGQNCISS